VGLTRKGSKNVIKSLGYSELHGIGLKLQFEYLGGVAEQILDEYHHFLGHGSL